MSLINGICLNMAFFRRGQTKYLSFKKQSNKSFILTVTKLVGPVLSPYVCFSCAPVVFLDYFSFAVLTVFFSVP